jgi:hypothetical protein
MAGHKKMTWARVILATELTSQFKADQGAQAVAKEDERFVQKRP